MPAVDINGLRVAYQRAGEGPPLVLLHGFICDSRVWQPQIEDLSRDFDVIAWDCPGCGESSDPPEDYTMSQFADCLAGLLDEIGLPSAHLLGLSWGGTLIMEFYRRFPDRVRSVVLAGTYAGWTGSLGRDAAEQRLKRCLGESEKPAEEWVPQWVPEAFSSSASRELLDEYIEIMSDFHPAGFRAMSRAVTPDFRDALSQTGVPALLIWGDSDTRSPLSNAEMIRDSIPGARLRVIEGAGHVSNMEQPERFNAEVRGFVLAADRREYAMSTSATGRAKPASIESLVESLDLGIEILHPGGLDVTRQMAELAAITKGSEVLDVASGTGESACFLAKTFGCRVHGVDISPDMVKRAARKAQKRGIDANFTTGDATDLLFEDDRFDVVISECTLCFLDKERVIAEMIRVAKPGGRVAIHDLAWKDGAPQRVKEKLAELESERPETLDGWRLLFEQAGLQDVNAVDRSDVIPGWMHESRKQMGLSGQAKALWKIVTTTGIGGLRRLWESERIFRSRHLGYGIIVGKKRV